MRDWPRNRTLDELLRPGGVKPGQFLTKAVQKFGRVRVVIVILPVKKLSVYTVNLTFEEYVPYNV